MRYSLTIIFILVLSNSGLFAQADSLKMIYDEESNDSLKSRICFELADHYLNIDTKISVRWGDKGVHHARKFKDPEYIMKSLVYSSYYYNRKGDYQEQIKLYLEALKIAEKNQFTEQQGTIAGNIGGAFLKLGDRKQALVWLERAIELKKKYSTKEKLAYSLSNLGAYYFEERDFNKAIDYHQQALDIRRENKDEENMAVDLGNLADCYIELNKFKEADDLLSEALSLRRSFSDDYGVVKGLMDFAFLYEYKRDFSRAIAYADSSYSLAVKNGYDDYSYENLMILANLHREIGNYKLSSEYSTKALELWQNIFTKEASDNLNELRTLYETERISNENALLKTQQEIAELNHEKNAATNSRLRLIILSIIIGMAVLAVVLFFFIRLNRNKRKMNIQLNEQKALTERKNEEILDSINYARRIQSAILPTFSAIQEALTDVFVIYRPKDVVAGDFYWLEQKNGWQIFAVADCTGHGVPGAMVSVFGNNALNRAVREHNLTDPGLILDKAREIMISEFKKNEDDVHDGMDIALCAKKGNLLLFAGAYNPIWIVRHGELIEYRGDKQPIGIFDRQFPFQTTSIELQEDDCVYLTTDGFADQFGGRDNKKYKTANFKKLLINIQHQPIKEQAATINATFDDWKKENEQVDDVCIMGFHYQSHENNAN